MTNTNTAKRTTYKIVGNFNICNQKRICLISLCFGKENAKQKLDEILKNKSKFILGDIIGEPYIVAEEEDGTEWYYGYTD
jgi:hypothetical protein